MPDTKLRFLWCDGFSPEQYLLADPSPCIKGRVWMGNGNKEEHWEFILFLNRPVRARSEIEWDKMLPPENTTWWLALDLVQKRMEVEPSAAVSETA